MSFDAEQFMGQLTPAQLASLFNQAESAKKEEKRNASQAALATAQEFVSNFRIRPSESEDSLREGIYTSAKGSVKMQDGTTEVVVITVNITTQKSIDADKKAKADKAAEQATLAKKGQEALAAAQAAPAESTALGDALADALEKAAKA